MAANSDFSQPLLQEKDVSVYGYHHTLNSSRRHYFRRVLDSIDNHGNASFYLANSLSNMIRLAYSTKLRPLSGSPSAYICTHLAKRRRLQQFALACNRFRELHLHEIPMHFVEK